MIVLIMYFGYSVNSTELVKISKPVFFKKALCPFFLIDKLAFRIKFNSANLLASNLFTTQEEKMKTLLI